MVSLAAGPSDPTPEKVAWLADKLLNCGEEAFDDGGMANDLAGYVATMNVDDGTNYLLAISGKEMSRSKFRKILLEMHGENMEVSATVRPSPQLKRDDPTAVFWGAEPAAPSVQVSSTNVQKNVVPKDLFKPKKKKGGGKSRGAMILSTSRQLDRPQERMQGTKGGSNETDTGRTDTMCARGQFYTNCVLCGTVVWYNEEKDKLCNSGLHPQCKNRPIDSVDPRTGQIDYTYGDRTRKKMSNRNKKLKEQELRTDPRTGKWVANYEAAVAQKDRLCAFDRQQAARSMVYDDQNDYFQQSESRWLNDAERDIASRKAEAIREKKIAQRTQVSISFDLAGRRVTRHIEDLIEGSDEP
jgi:hypothetical protein